MKAKELVLLVKVVFINMVCIIQCCFILFLYLLQSLKNCQLLVSFLAFPDGRLAKSIPRLMTNEDGLSKIVGGVMYALTSCTPLIIGYYYLI